MRSAKSVAWMRLKVVGVNISFLLPRRVVCRTSGEEVHSLKATAYPCDRSQWLRRESWVDLPEPSIPSTTMSLPRWRFGASRVMCCPHCTPQRLRSDYEGLRAQVVALHLID